MPLTEKDFDPPYDLNHGPGVVAGTQPPVDTQTTQTTPPVEQSDAGRIIRSILPMPDEARNLLAQKSPSWRDVAIGANDRVEYLFNQLSRGWDERLGRQVGPPAQRPDIVTGALGNIFEGVGRDPILYAFPGLKYAAMTGNVIDELAQGFPDWERNLLGGVSQFLNPRSLIASAMHGGLSKVGEKIAGPTGRVIGSLLHSPEALIRELIKPGNWGRALVAGHEAGINQNIPTVDVYANRPSVMVQDNPY